MIKNFKPFILLALLTVVFTFRAIAADWPGTGNCAGSLQACIDSQPDNGTIQVKTNSLAFSGGTITIAKGFNLSAGIGYHPIFSNVTINVTVSSGEKITIKGFEFEFHSVIYATVRENSELSILSNNWVDPRLDNSHEGIIVLTEIPSGELSNVTIKGNNIDGSNSNSYRGYIDIHHNTDGNLKLFIVDNHITAKHQDVTGIVGMSIGNKAAGILDCQIIGNEIRGGQHQITLAQSVNVSPLSQFNVGIVSNLLTGKFLDGSHVNSTEPHIGIRSLIWEGNFKGVFGNNTIDGVERTGVSDGAGFDFSFHTTAGSSSIDILNNIIVNTKDVYIGPASGTSMSVDSLGNNLIFGHETITGLVLDASDMNAPVKFIEEGINYGLTSVSPAIDVANTFVTALIYSIGVMAGSPKIDADGLRRYKGVRIDLGAYEWGDRHILHTAINPNNITNLSDNGLNTNINAVPIVTPIWNYEGSNGVYNDHPLGVYYFNSIWRIFDEDAQNMTDNSKYHLFYPYGTVSDDANGLAQLINPESTDSGYDLNLASISDNPSAGIFATNFWQNSAGGVYNPSSLEVGYKNDGTWYLGNVDGSDMPTDAQAFIYSQDASRNVFHHEVTDSNTTNHVTLIDHPLLNGNPCALPTVTQSTSWFFAPLFEQNPHNIGVFYSDSENKWAIFNQDLADLTVIIVSPVTGGRFNVMVDPQQVYQCNDIIFKNSFE